VASEEALERVARLATDEMARRLETNADGIPDHVLSKIMVEVYRLLDRREKSDEAEPRPFSLLDEVDSLPDERAQELLEEEATRLQAELDQYKAALKSRRPKRTKQPSSPGS
jgi:hypothetical protein